MCGIVGYIGDGTRSVDELVEALRRLEYRGYDSAGIAMRDENGKLLYKRAKGRIDSLADKLPKGVMARSYISHTRWATHGKPSEQNAHPHSDCAKKIFVVHNGIIENYRELGDALSKKGHEMRTETDTEVIPHLIEEEMKGGVSFPEAVHRAVAHLKGAYAIIALSKDEDTLVATRLGSPLILGIGKNMEVGAGEGERAREFFLASDPTALLSFTRDVIYIDENERVEITPTTYKITGADRKVVPHEHVTLEWSEEDAGKGGYAHFMQKE
ncbi:MAG: glutamine--fructose-6-phosphate aminotransferase, partial [Candidatus Vogelbacteria bacterium CG10_big_fil_rev_8_21_14_0_10_45_14]